MEARETGIAVHCISIRKGRNGHVLESHIAVETGRRMNCNGYQMRTAIPHVVPHITCLQSGYLNALNDDRQQQLGCFKCGDQQIVPSTQSKMIICDVPASCCDQKTHTKPFHYNRMKQERQERSNVIGLKRDCPGYGRNLQQDLYRYRNRHCSECYQ